MTDLSIERVFREPPIRDGDPGLLSQFTSRATDGELLDAAQGAGGTGMGLLASGIGIGLALRGQKEAGELTAVFGTAEAAACLYFVIKGMRKVVGHDNS